jgi:malonyl-CoA decarboxylase
MAFDHDSESLGDLARSFAAERKLQLPGVALARRLIELWENLDASARRDWFTVLATDFGSEPTRLRAAVDGWLASPSAHATAELHAASEPLRQELFRSINLAPGGTATLVDMRAALLAELANQPALEVVDADLSQLLSLWFNRGFLVLRRIEWSSAADILEKMIRFEAVHEIAGWDDLRSRLTPPDRRCFALFHPQMPDDPLIFLEIALTRRIPDSVDQLLSAQRELVDIEQADTAVFYSISKTLAGLKGIPFGNFLIKQAVEELAREIPGLQTFVTLSPVPGFACWLAAARSSGASIIGHIDASNSFAALEHDAWYLDNNTRAKLAPLLEKAVAAYLLSAKDPSGEPYDPVARFHLRDGACLDRINVFADLSPKRMKQSHGVMVNYRYDRASVERNRGAYADQGAIVASAAVQRLAS